MDETALHLLEQIKQSLDYVSWRHKQLGRDLDSLHRNVGALLEEAKKVPPDALASTKKT